jgi:hypothetical protein
MMSFCLGKIEHAAGSADWHLDTPQSAMRARAIQGYFLELARSGGSDRSIGALCAARAAPHRRVGQRRSRLRKNRAKARSEMSDT